MGYESKSWRTAVIAIGAIEAVGIAVYGVLVLIYSRTEGTSGAVGSDVSPLVLFVTYLVFAAIIGWIVWGLSRNSSGARTPYLLTQGFALVVAQTLLAGGEAFEKVMGAALGVLAALGAFGLLKKLPNPRA